MAASAVGRTSDPSMDPEAWWPLRGSRDDSPLPSPSGKRRSEREKGLPRPEETRPPKNPLLSR